MTGPTRRASCLAGRTALMDTIEPMVAQLDQPQLAQELVDRPGLRGWNSWARAVYSPG